MIAGRQVLLIGFVLVVAGILAMAADPPPPSVRVTVVVVFACSGHKEVHPKLTALAQEVQKKNEKWTGFKLAATLQKSIPVGESDTFELVEGQNLKVTVDKPKDKTGRIGMTLDAPGLGEIQYSCVCDKFVPVITPHVTKTGEQLIIAVLAKPCSGK